MKGFFHLCFQRNKVCHGGDGMARLQEPEADWAHFFMHTIEAERSGGEAMNPWTSIPVMASSSDAAPPKGTISTPLKAPLTGN